MADIDLIDSMIPNSTSPYADTQYPSGDRPSAFEVSSVSGAFAEGQDLVIFGGGFGSEGPLVVSADNFFGKSDGQLLSINDAQVGQYAEIANIGTYEAAQGLAGNVGLRYQDGALAEKSSYAPILGVPNASEAIRIAAGISEAEWQGWLPFKEFKIFTAIYGNGGSYNSKDTWLMLGHRGDNGADPGQGNDIVLLNDTGASLSMHSNTNNIPTIYPNTSGTYKKDNWNFHTITMNSEAANAVIDYTGRNGTGINEQTFTPLLNWQTDPEYYDRVKLGGYSQAGVTDKRWFGAVYLAVTDTLSGTNRYAKCCVEIYNAATPETASIAGVMPSTAWADGVITVKCWTLGIAEADAYIRVVDKDNNSTPMVKLTEVLV